MFHVPVEYHWLKAFYFRVQSKVVYRWWMVAITWSFSEVRQCLDFVWSDRHFALEKISPDRNRPISRSRTHKISGNFPSSWKSQVESKTYSFKSIVDIFHSLNNTLWIIIDFSLQLFKDVWSHFPLNEWKKYESIVLPYHLE